MNGVISGLQLLRGKEMIKIARNNGKAIYQSLTEAVTLLDKLESTVDTSRFDEWGRLCELIEKAAVLAIPEEFE